MTSYVYVVKDELSAQFNLYASFVNKAVAERNFQRDVNSRGMFTTDLMLYESGTIDSDTGVFDAYASPIFICRGVKENEIQDTLYRPEKD